MLDDLKAVFRDAFDLSPDVDFRTVRYGEIPTWDSLQHMALIGDLEDRFDIMLETDDVIGMASFDDAVRILKKYGVQFAA
jgi:acyl carrier protein